MSEQVNHFSLGCVVKYLCRSEYKNSTIEDLEKASWYLNREIQRRKLEMAEKDEKTKIYIKK